MRWSPFSPIAPGYQSASLSASPPPAAPSLSEFPFLPNFVSFVLPGQDVGLFIHSRSRAPRRFPSPPLGHDRAMRESLDLQRHSKGAFSHHATFMEVYTQWNAVWKFSSRVRKFVSEQLHSVRHCNRYGADQHGLR